MMGGVLARLPTRRKKTQNRTARRSVVFSFSSFCYYMKNGEREIKKTDQLSQSFNTNRENLLLLND